MYVLLFILFLSQVVTGFYLIYSILFNSVPDKCIYILRGLPGSGKTSKIAEVCNNITDKDCYRICNYQNYLNENNPRDIPKSYNLCFSKFMKYLDYDSIRYIFVDNPNIETWEYQNYIDLAKLYGYKVKILEMDCPDYNYIEYFWSRCNTKINLDNIISMWNRWESYKGKDVSLKIIEPYVEIDVSSQGDSLPFPKKSLEELDSELQEFVDKRD